MNGVLCNSQGHITASTDANALWLLSHAVQCDETSWPDTLNHDEGGDSTAAYLLQFRLSRSAEGQMTFHDVDPHKELRLLEPSNSLDHPQKEGGTKTANESRKET